ncbi:MAG TPA: FAD:protein FMN transferase [Pseudonocardiaceae bacterium]|jgi:thiamine biosynthesis lipoprotein|nr:FAD:protein FMN transferase [Pseudonocardiaceae bacterium]
MDTAGTTIAALGSTATLVVTEPGRLAEGERLLRAELAELDLACSRFRPDSEISRLHERAGTAVTVSPLLADALAAALRAARLTDGLVDPTVGRAVRELGYDRDFAHITDSGPVGRTTPAPGWWRVSFDHESRQVLLPRDVLLDLGATAKAFGADRAAARLARELGCGALVSLGGDVSVAGVVPPGGWRIGVGDDHRRAMERPDVSVAIIAGGLATSTIACRRWRRGGRQVHHIVDPRTGDIPDPVWRTVSVAAVDCVDANTASTAAIVLGAAAPEWLVEQGLPARLVGVSGEVRAVADWPAELAEVA